MNVKSKIKIYKLKIKFFFAAMYLNLGAKLVRKGALLQPGQPIRFGPGQCPSIRHRKNPKFKNGGTLYIYNMYFDFGRNKIQYKYSEKPIKGLSSQFKK